MTVEFENDFYSGSMDMPGERDDYEWNFRKSSVAALVASSVAAANIALFVF